MDGNNPCEDSKLQMFRHFVFVIGVKKKSIASWFLYQSSPRSVHCLDFDVNGHMVASVLFVYDLTKQMRERGLLT